MKKILISITEIFASISRRFENHEAIISNIINQGGKALNNAQSKLNRTIENRQRLEALLQKTQEEMELWKERTLKIYSEDKNVALECVKRRRTAGEKVAALKSQIEEQIRLENQLRTELKTIAAKLENLKLKRDQFRIRASSAKANNYLNSAEEIISTYSDEIFESWEDEIHDQGNYPANFQSQSDPLEESFLSEEEKLSLEETLKELVENK